MTRKRRQARRPTPPWSRTVLCRLTRPATPCLVAGGGARATGVVRRTTRRKKRKRRRMSTPPPAMLAHTGTCTPLTVGTQAASTVPTGTSHRTGCSNAKLSKVTTRGTTASAAAPGPETPTEQMGRPGLQISTEIPTPHLKPYGCHSFKQCTDGKKLPPKINSKLQSETNRNRCPVYQTDNFRSILKVFSATLFQTPSSSKLRGCNDTFRQNSTGLLTSAMERFQATSCTQTQTLAALPKVSLL